MPDSPFGVAVTPDGRWAFVALPSSVEVLRTGAALAPVKVATINVMFPGPANRLLAGSMAGVTLTRNGQYLLVAARS